MRPLASIRSHAGVTLVEMLITVVIVGVILAAAVPSVTGLIERRRVIAAAGEIANIFAYARSEANTTTAAGNALNLHLEAVPTSFTEFGSCVRLSAGAVGDTCACNVKTSKLCKTPLGTSGVLLREFTLPRNQSVSFEASAKWGAVGHIVSFQRDMHMTSVQDLAVEVTGSKTGAKLNVEYNNAGRVRICSPGGTVSGFPVCT